MIELLKYPYECTVCDTKIRHYSRGKIKKLPEYNEIEVQLNDLSKMKVGVCPAHTKPKKLELQIIMEKTRHGWAEEVAFGIGNAEWVSNRAPKLEITGVAV